MTLRLYLDHNVRSAVAVGLRRRGVDVLTAAEDGRERLEDEALLARAAEPAEIENEVQFLPLRSFTGN